MVSFLVNGLHLSILIIIFENAINKLYFRKARTAYSEQVGLNLHAGLIIGDILLWYCPIKVIKNSFI